MTEASFNAVYSPSDVKENSPVRRFIRHFDWVLFCDALFLSLAGLVMVYSASLRFGHPGLYLGKQFLALMLGLMMLFVLATVNYQIFSQYPKAIFAFSIFLLVLVLAAGKTYHGTKAWFLFGPFAFQPTEICKLFVILVIAAWCDKNIKEIKNLKNLAVPFMIVFAHVFLIMLQPDFGSTLVYVPILLGILFVAGADLMHLLAMMVYISVVIFIVLFHTFLSLMPDFLEAHPVWSYLYRGMTLGKEFALMQVCLGAAFWVVWWFMKQLKFRVHGLYFLITFSLIASGSFSSSIVARVMKDYQRKRLVVLFNPNIDPTGAGYHIIQSVIAIGSGKIFGKGLFGGTQTRLGFLPEQHTDFIFSVVGEELGFVGGGIILLLYLLLLWRAIVIAGDARDRFGSLVAVGICSMFAFYSILNLSMVMGLAPVTGLPLPFLSYGGSSLISSLSAIGLLLSVHARRYTY